MRTCVILHVTFGIAVISDADKFALPKEVKALQRRKGVLQDEQAVVQGA